MISSTNPLSQPSRLPFGLPVYGQITVQHLDEALREGMRSQRAEWESVATNTEPPTVENTLLRLDQSGDLLSRAASVFWTLASSVGGVELDALQEELAPLFAEHADAYQLDNRIYRRFLELRDTAGLDAESKWSVEQEIADFEREGVSLPGQDKERLRSLNVQISALETAIEQRIAKQLTRTGLALKDEADLVGLDLAAKSSYKTEGGWFIPCRNFSTQPEQAILTSPKVRRALLQQSVTRGGAADPEADTRGRIIELVHLRAQRAELLGFPDHASAVMDAETVPDPGAAHTLLTEVGTAARERVAHDALKLSEIAESDVDGQGFEAADWPYYEDRLRAIELGFDGEQLRPYLEFQRVLEDGVFWAAHQLYGITMLPREDLEGWHEDVQTWEVRESDGTPLGLFIGDFYNRPGKAGGAWMAEIQTPDSSRGIPPIISNDANFTKPSDDGAHLLSWDDVETLFHEFGHALHGLFSNTRYRDNAGTNVPRDFVELPSQLNEMWAFHPRVLANYARHHETGEPIPKKMLNALVGSKMFGQGFATAEYVQAALIDQAWHTTPTARLPLESSQVSAFEESALEEIGQWEPLVPPRYRSAYFAHTFAGGYDAGYYAYMWAEMLSAEVEKWFRTDGALDGDGGLNREAGEKFRKELLSRGDSRDPMESFRAVTGKEPTSESVLTRRGLR